MENHGYILTALRVEIAGRLVGQNQRRVVYQRPRDGNPLLLTTRQSGRHRMPASRQVQQLDKFVRPLSRLITLLRYQYRWKKNVFLDVQRLNLAQVFLL